MDVKIIYDLLKEMRGDISVIKEDITSIKIEVTKNARDMKHHIKRTDLLQDLHESNKKVINNNEERISELEEPKKAKKWLKAQWLTVGSIAAAGISVLGLATKVMGLW